MIALVLAAGGCATPSQDARPAGEQLCESFFIYVLCIADFDRNGRVDYMYFDDTRDIFMYNSSMLEQLKQLLPLHPCALPMSASTEEYSSQLLYAQNLGLSKRIGLKGRLMQNYRTAQAGVDACYANLKKQRAEQQTEKPFLIEDDWEEGAL